MYCTLRQCATGGLSAGCSGHVCICTLRYKARGIMVHVLPDSVL